MQIPPELDTQRIFACGEQELFAVAHAVGARSLNAVDVFGGSWSLDEAATAFAGLCDRAADHNLLVHLEFLPWSRIPDLATAWQIVRAADRPNGGIMLDAWHYFRGGSDGALLRSIPGAAILGVQLGDAPATPEPEPLHATLHERLLPGSGELALRTLLADLRETGTTAPLGVEVFSTSCMPWTLRRSAGWRAHRCAPCSIAVEGSSGQGEVVEIDAAWRGFPTLHTTRSVPAAVVSLSDTIRHEVQVDGSESADGEARARRRCRPPPGPGSAHRVDVTDLATAIGRALRGAPSITVCNGARRLYGNDRRTGDLGVRERHRRVYPRHAH